MNVFISMDWEGCSGIVSRQETMPEGAFYQEARLWMLWDANAAVEGCLEAGASEVLICDNHNGLEIPWDQIHPRARLVHSDLISARTMYGLDGLDNTFDAVFFVGHHTAYGDAKGVISHTLSRPFRDVYINGLRVGDIEIWSALAGHVGVPVGLVTGDDALCQQAKAQLPWIETATVKYAIDTYAARCLPKEEAHGRIRRAAREATQRIPHLELYQFSAPIQVEVDLVTPNAAGRAALIPGIGREGGTRIGYTADDYGQAYRTLLAVAWLAMSANDPIPW